jgi:CRP-like cAMP-binding protein
VLGRSEAISGYLCKLTARAAERTRVAYVSRENLLEFLRQHQAFCMQIVRLLSEDLHLLYGKYRYESNLASRLRKGKSSDAAGAGGTII